MRAMLTSVMFSCLFAVGFMVPTTVFADGPCQWRGQAPFCNGSCQPGETVGERNKQGPAGSKKCTTGTKVKCCLNSICTWRGKAPLCNAKCQKNEDVTAESKDGDGGATCATGKKKLCCKD